MSNEDFNCKNICGKYSTNDEVPVNELMFSIHLILFKPKVGPNLHQRCTAYSESVCQLSNELFATKTKNTSLDNSTEFRDYVGGMIQKCFCF